MHSSAELNRLSFVISITRKKISLVYRLWVNHVTDLDKKKIIVKHSKIHNTLEKRKKGGLFDVIALRQRIITRLEWKIVVDAFDATRNRSLLPISRICPRSVPLRATQIPRFRDKNAIFCSRLADNAFHIAGSRRDNSARVIYVHARSIVLHHQLFLCRSCLFFSLWSSYFFLSLYMYVKPIVTRLYSIFLYFEEKIYTYKVVCESVQTLFHRRFISVYRYIGIL